MNAGIVHGPKQYYAASFEQYLPAAVGDLLGDLLGDVGFNIHDVIAAVNAADTSKDGAVKLYNYAAQAVDDALAATAATHSTFFNLFSADADTEKMATDNLNKARDALVAASSKAFADPAGGMPALRKAAIQCFIEYDAAAERNAALGKNRAGFYTDIVNGLKAAAKAIAGIGIGVGGLALALGVGWLVFRRRR